MKNSSKSIRATTKEAKASIALVFALSEQDYDALVDSDTKQVNAAVIHFANGKETLLEPVITKGKNFITASYYDKAGNKHVDFVNRVEKTTAQHSYFKYERA